MSASTWKKTARYRRDFQDFYVRVWLRHVLFLVVSWCYVNCVRSCLRAQWMLHKCFILHVTTAVVQLHSSTVAVQPFVIAFHWIILGLSYLPITGFVGLTYNVLICNCRDKRYCCFSCFVATKSLKPVTISSSLTCQFSSASERTYLANDCIPLVCVPILYNLCQSSQFSRASLLLSVRLSVSPSHASTTSKWFKIQTRFTVR